ncbi:hypothetical protein PRABACTJOHN_03141 [Parabacteroides johnsonii DSM 18315]|uniref:Uncharacterized protein n=1 Tax=Parabacteroides johnsonii DSM 18315 TaxID=537006 RepID=B7BDL8_9BACT|nr:hypothetical protein PARMER_03502 [Parabacteroides merdae ATCC 43184]EEC95473.1 hypothetical protein PRABACTJOHN_03141 [Parabacteroides johnsonii DSM 18315]
MIHYVFCLDLAKLNRANGIITIRTKKYIKKSRNFIPGLSFTSYLSYLS